jgi:hypothetical protein
MLSGALEEQNMRLAGGPVDMCADTCIYLQDGARVRTHSLVLAAGSAYFRHLAQVGCLTYQVKKSLILWLCYTRHATQWIINASGDKFFIKSLNVVTAVGKVRARNGCRQ